MSDGETCAEQGHPEETPALSSDEGESNNTQEEGAEKEEQEEDEVEEEEEDEEEEKPTKHRGRGMVAQPLLDPEDWPVIEPETKLVSFKSRILNVHLACTLCMGYFRNAYTITECLHTYCKDCILKYFQESKKDCPTCGHDLSPYPMELIRHDRTLQSIVDKVIIDEYSQNQEGRDRMLPSREATNRRTRADVEKEKNIYHYPVPETASKRPIPEAEVSKEKRQRTSDDQEQHQEEAEAARTEDERGPGEKVNQRVPAKDLAAAAASGHGRASDSKTENNDTDTPPKASTVVAPAVIEKPKLKAPPEMSFCLRWDEANDIPGSKLKSLEKPYLRTSSAITILHLKKYLTQKFEVSNDTALLQFRCKDLILDDHSKVADVYEDTWLDSTADLELFFSQKQ